MSIDVLIQDCDEFGDNGIPAQGDREFAVDINGRDRLFKRARQ